MAERKVYEQPKLSRVSIRPADSVLSYCRSGGGDVNPSQAVCSQQVEPAAILPSV